MARIVISSWGSYGDVNPYVGLALALRARGHTPVLAIPTYYRAAVESTGLEHAAVGPDVDGDTTLVGRIMHARTGTEFLLRELLAPAVDRTYEQLRAAARGADLLVTHPVTFAGPVLAEATGMPWVSTVLAPASFMSEHDPFVMPPAPWLKQVERVSRWPSVMLMRLAHRMTRRWMAPVDALRARLGLPRGRHPVFEGQHSPTRVLALFSRVLAEPQADWPPNVRITGHIFYDAAHGASLAPELARFLDDGEPPVVFTLGTSAVMAAGRFYEESIEAARRLERRAVLLAGSDRSAQLASSLPFGMLAVDQAPHSLLMPRAAAVVQQCGIGTLGQALRAGRPILAVPFAHDQPDNAWRATRLGVARTIPARRYGARRAERELGHLLNNEVYGARAHTVGEQVREEDGAARACEAIEEVLTLVPA
jgi:UDP:flavonoid glycosyltransferase YjiC (YdhE family)